MVVLWIAPADGYQLQLVDPAHPVAPLVHVKGNRATGPGTIYFVDVRERPARLIERLLPWARANGSSLVRSPPISSSLDRRLGQVEMLDSQKIAPYVALKLLGYRVTERTAGVNVLQVENGAPASKVLQPNDLILAVDGQPVKTIAELHGVLGRKHPGDRLEIRFRRGNAIRKATVTTKAAADNSKQATALCPAGKRVVGTGANLETDSGDVAGRVALEQISPVSNWDVRAAAADVGAGSTLRWAVVAVAFCAYVA